MPEAQTTDAVIGSPDAVVDALLAAGWRVIGPRERDGAIVYEPLSSGRDLPRGRIDRIAPGRYGLEAGDPDRWFDYVVGPQNWKRWLFPPRQKLWTARRDDNGVTFDANADDWPRTAFFGVRPCDLAALGILDQVFGTETATDPTYRARRAATLIVAVQCARSAPTCFCASMNTGPHASAGFDLALTELGGSRFLAAAATTRGQEVLAGLDGAPADATARQAAEAARDAAVAGQTRAMPADIAPVLAASPEAPRWDQVADRCLACANCTLACPTCFCTDTEDINDLTGDHAERWRVWDSCFNTGFSYIHGGEVRGATRSRYRQWMTHKLSSWQDQFGTSGCVGCGRCIAWCPVGIDITEEAAAIAVAPETAE